MTVFCPNCGKPNTDQATQCISCGTALKPTAAGGAAKFKGTMMMGSVNAPNVPGPPPAQPPQPAPPAAPPPAAADAEKQKLAFQATMFGPIAPPPGGVQPTSPFAASGTAPTHPPPQSGAPNWGGGIDATAPTEAFQSPVMSQGQPPSNAPPPSGFGQPPSSSFGSPHAGMTPPMGTGASSYTPGMQPPMGPPPGGPQGGGYSNPPGSGGGDNKKKIFLFVGIGCLFFLVISCLGGFFAYRACANKVKGITDTINTTGSGNTDIQAPASAGTPDPGAPDPGSIDTSTACGQYSACCSALSKMPGMGVLAQGCAQIERLKDLPTGNQACAQAMTSIRQSMANNPNAPAECK